jgi:hypothetical protein
VVRKKVTRSYDGVDRFTVQIKFRVSFDDLVTVASHLAYLDMQITKESIEEELRDLLMTNGKQLAGMDWDSVYRQEQIEPTFEELERLVKKFYPEFRQ